MNYPAQEVFGNGSNCGAAPSAAEETLRLIAHLPPPQGLEDRVRAGLHSRRRKGHILAWPTGQNLDSNWMRTAAAAAIVFVVAGGGWGIYSSVQQPQAAKTPLAMPPRVAAQGGFSSAGAMRTPQTIKGPVLTLPAAIQPTQAKASARTAQKPVRRMPTPAQGVVSKAVGQTPSQSAASPSQ
jgi:hypothetical protein